jgi:hypothetical protein
MTGRKILKKYWMPIQDRQYYAALLYIYIQWMSLHCKCGFEKMLHYKYNVCDYTVCLFLKYCSVNRVTDFQKGIQILTLHVIDL